MGSKTHRGAPGGGIEVLETPGECFVAEMGRELGLGRRAVDQRCRRILHRLVDWAIGEGLGLDPEAILDPDVVERFCKEALAGDKSQATFRSDLRRMGPLLTKTAPWEPRPAPMARRLVAAPYSDDEVALLRADSFNQPSRVRERGARALLSLGIGAGLDGRWIALVGPDDVRKRDSVVEVTVGEPAPRRVVVRAEWEAEVLELARSAGSGCLLGRRSSSRNRVGDLAKSLARPASHPRLSPGRLRATWLRLHLEEGTRLPELCKAAGLKGFEVLSDLMRYVEPLNERDADLVLRGRRS